MKSVLILNSIVLVAFAYSHNSLQKINLCKKIDNFLSFQRIGDNIVSSRCFKSTALFLSNPDVDASAAILNPNSDNYIKAEGSGSPCRIKVIGVGGGGGNAVNRMIESSSSIPGVEMWVVNTDAQALSRSLATKRLNIGKVLSR